MQFATLFTWVVLLCCALPLHAKSEKEESDAEKQRRLTYYYLAAEQQKSQENYAAMAELLLHCLEIDPDNPAANFDLAMVQLSLDKDTVALRTLKKAIANDPNNPWYLESLASVYLSMRKIDEAVPVLEHMSKLQSKRTDILAQLFQLYKSTGRNGDAIKVLDRIQTLQGNSTRIASQKFALYLAQGDTTEAFNQLRALCQEYPYDASCLLLLGDQFMTIDQPDSAKAIYAKVERIDPKNVMLQTSRLQYYLLTGDTIQFRAKRDSLVLDDKADLSLRVNGLGSVAREGLADSTLRQHTEFIFAKLLAEEKPAVPFLQLYMAYRAYTYKETTEQLIPIMERILQVEPSDMQTLQEMLQFYARNNDYVRVGELCQQALIYHPSELMFHYFLAISLAQQEKKREACDALTTAIRQPHDESQAPMMGDIYALLGDIEHELNDEKAAFEAYDSCLVYAPDNVGCLNNYAYFLALKGEQLEKAEQMSYRTIKAEPSSKTYLDTYAWVLFVQKDYTTARIYMERIINPSTPDSTLLADDEVTETLLEHAGDINAQCEQTEQALRYWQLAKQKMGDAKNAVLNKKIKKRKYLQR